MDDGGGGGSGGGGYGIDSSLTFGTLEVGKETDVWD